MRQGDVVGARFTIERLAGHGGMGAVYRARDGESGRVAAVKALFERTPVAIQRFAREAALLASVRHPNVVAYLAHDVAAIEPWLAMEWVEGENLEDRLSQRGATPDEAVAIVRQAAEALGAAHRRGVVHRDVKPSNLMLAGGDPGRVKLLDFGVARGDRSGALTQTGAVVGSPFYMAPEQAKGDPRIDARADVFSLGCVLFRALTGRLPFEGPSAPAVLLRIVLDEAPRLGDVRPDLPPALASAVARMLAKSRDDRPADGIEAAALLAAIGPIETSDVAPRPGITPALTTSERRVTALVLARPRDVEERTGHGTHVLAPEDGELREAITRHGGALDVLADGTVVVATSAEGAVTDQAERAARCALAIRALPRIEAVAIAFGEHEVTGRASVGALVDVGLGFLDARTPHVRVDPRLARLLEARFELGKDGHGVVLRGARDAAMPGGSTLLGRSVPCVGRESELGVLEATVAHAFDEPAASAALVLAPAGIGKSRLARELLARLATRETPPTIWIARGDPLRAGSPFGLLGPLLRSQAGIAEGDAPETSEAKLRERVARRVPPADVARVTELLAALASIPLASPPSAALLGLREDPRRLAEAMRRAFTDLVRAEILVRPLVFVIEDLHFGDLPTVKALDAVLGELAAAPFLVLALGRPETAETFPRLWEGRGLQTLSLRELGRRPSERLVRAALGDGATDAAVSRIVGRAAGNAFFLEELVRAEAAGQGAALPETVLATVAARLTALDPEARRILRAASVFGDAFWRGGLLALLGAGADAPSTARVASADDWIGALEEGELVSPRAESRFPGEPELVFRHALVREAAYAMLTDADRALGHRLAGRWLEERGERDRASLANHFERGGDRARAAEHHVAAGRDALRADDLKTAAASARRAVASGATGPLLGAARLVELEALRFDGDAAASTLAAADEAIALLPPGTEDYFRAVGLRVSCYFNNGRALDAAESLARLAFPAEVGAEAARAMALGRAAHILVFTGEAELADQALAELERHGEDELDVVTRALTSRALGLSARTRQEIDAQLYHFGRSHRFYDLGGEPQGTNIVLTDLATLYADIGLYEEALAIGEEALLAGTKAGLGFFIAGGRTCIGRALAGLGRVEEAREMLDAAIALATTKANASVIVGWAKVELATLLLGLGEAALAERAAAEAAVLFAHVALAVAGPHALRAQALLALGRVDEALAVARTAALQAASGSAYAPLVRLALAEALLAAGERDEARAVIVEARRRLLLAAGEIGDARMRASFLENVPAHVRTLALASTLGDAG